MTLRESFPEYEQMQCFARSCSKWALASSASLFTIVASRRLESAGPQKRPTFDSCPESACKSSADLFGSLLGPAKRTKDCPAHREELGAATWLFVSPALFFAILKPRSRTHSSQLHTTAAYYPDIPSSEERAAAAGIVEGLLRLYPCLHCRARLQEEAERDPPDVSSGPAFSAWLCRQHNAVNTILGAWCDGHAHRVVIPPIRTLLPSCRKAAACV